MANVVNHFEIHGIDGKKTQDFYAGLLGWSIDANNPMNYGMVLGRAGHRWRDRKVDGWEADGHHLRGGRRSRRDAREGAGARRQHRDAPSDVPGGPKLAQFADPDGNVIGLTQAGTMQS